MSNKGFDVMLLCIGLFVLGLVVAMIGGWVADIHELHVAEDKCVDYGYYFVEEFDRYYYCVEHHSDGSKTSYRLDILERD